MDNHRNRRRGATSSTMLAGGGLLLAVLACAGWQWRATKSGGAGAAAVHPALVPRAVPTPTATPDPQEVPAWARGQVIKKVPVDPATKVFALTFDDGPWPHSTHAILGILAGYNIKATFFMIGGVLRQYPRLGREVRDAGHAIGNHSWSHPIHSRDPVREVTRTDAAIEQVLHVRPTFFRPPYGLLNNGLAQQAMREHYPVLLWSDDANDWKRPPADRLARTVIREASPGGIALMHDGGGDRSQTVAALPVIISTLQARGYRFVTIPELLKLRYIKKPAAAKKPPVKPHH